MSLDVANPAGLAALAALPLPILLHLARRTEQRVTPFAALAWIGRRQPPRQRIRLAEWLLLALRLALIFAIALWWAEPVWHGSSPDADAVVLVAPEVDLTTLPEPLPDVERHWLAPGFPHLDARPPAGAQPLSSLLREFDASLAPGVRLLVVVPDPIDGLDGAALRLAHECRVIPVAGRQAASVPKEPATIAVALRFHEAAAPANATLRAAVAAWNAAEPDRFRLDAAAASAPIGADVAWLLQVDGVADAAVLAFAERGGTALTIAAADSDAPPLWRDEEGRVLARERRVGRGRLVELAAAPTPATFPAVLDPGFATTLRRLMSGESAAPRRGAAAAVAPSRIAAAAAAVPGQPLQAALALAVALLFLVERVLANGARLRGAG